MDTWPRLTNAPIVESLIDLRVERSTNLTFQNLRAAADELAADFPSREEMRFIEGQLTFSAEAGASLAAQAPMPAGVMLRSADGRWVAQFRLDGFTFSRLQPPYTNWADLSTRARQLWTKYTAVSVPNRVTRVATRFINRISLPAGKSFDETFTTTFSIAASLPQAVGGFLLRVVIPFEKEQCVVIMTQSLPGNTQECTFDIDAFAEFPHGISDADAWAKIEQLREVKNRVFFESLTPGALERYI
jgi:uncharacterized protein (TIGR04255 family)